MRAESGTLLYILSLGTERAAVEFQVGEILGRPVQAVQGCYEGKLEWSVLVPADEYYEHLPAFQEALSAASQDCVLYLDGQRNAYLVRGPYDGDGLEYDFRAGDYKFLGELKSVELATLASNKFPKSYTIIGERLHYVR